MAEESPALPSGESTPGKTPLRQSAVLPVRRDAEGAAVCLITSIKKKHWILPKGIVDPGESPTSTAIKEAFEEAGLLGRIVGEPLGHYQDTKWGSLIEVTVFLMEVDRYEHHWPESHLRKRLFAPISVAEGLIKKGILKEMVRRAMERLKET